MRRAAVAAMQYPLAVVCIISLDEKSMMRRFIVAEER
jgi:hypothetical protein